MISNFVKTERGSVLSDGREYFPASKIAEMLKLSRTAIYKKAAKEKWPEIRIPGKGARNGVAHYLVPAKILMGESPIKNTTDPKHYPASTATYLVTGTEKHNGLSANSHSGNEIMVNNFVTVPKYDLPLTSGGRDLTIHSAQVVDHLAFKKEWLEEMSMSTNCLALIAVKDDSMEPTLRSDDLILTDTSSGHIENNSIYVLRLDNELIVKRIQRKVNGAVIVKSDNPVYGEEEFDAQSAQALPVVGKVIWYGRRI